MPDNVFNGCKKYIALWAGEKKAYALYSHHIVLIRLVFTTALDFKECVNLRVLSDISGIIGMKMGRSLVSITKTATKTATLPAECFPLIYDLNSSKV